MKEFISTDKREPSKSTRISAIVAGLFFILIGIFQMSIYPALICIFMIAAMLLRKKTAVTEEGIVVTYDVVFYQYVEKWMWDEIQEIHKELSPEGTTYALHFMKDIMSKRLLFSISDAQQVLKFAEEMNPSIHIAAVDK